MNQFEFIVAIVAIVMIASVFRARYGYRRRGREGRDEPPPAEAAENRRLREEVQSLRDRIAVLERITIEKESSLEREIEQLRDR
jgi:predicted alpha/beta-hydrolase family hydrolase